MGLGGLETNKQSPLTVGRKKVIFHVLKIMSRRKVQSDLVSEVPGGAINRSFIHSVHIAWLKIACNFDSKGLILFSGFGGHLPICGFRRHSPTHSPLHTNE